jgi:putative ABC transport system ATP-binding protein
MSELALRTLDVCRHFEEGRIRALDGISLDVRRGDSVAVVGPSGCGKTTLLHMLGVLDRPTSGAVWVADHQVTTKTDLDRLRAREIGFIFQLHNLLPTLTAVENVEMPMVALSTKRAERRVRALLLLERVGLEKRANSSVTKLSGGERQRVAVARALANRPRIVLGDEPTGSLDSAAGAAVIDLLLELRAELGLTLVIVTHEASVAERLERRVELLDGRLVAD